MLKRKLPDAKTGPLASTNDGGAGQAAVIAQLSYALDLTNGEARGQSVRTCWLGMQIGREINLDDQALADLYYTLLLKELGASAASHEIYQTYQTDDLTFQRDIKTIDEGFAGVLNFILAKTGRVGDFGQGFRTLAKTILSAKPFNSDFIETRAHFGAAFAQALGFSQNIAASIAAIDEHWDGKGHPNSIKGDAIPLNARIALLAQIMEGFFIKGGRLTATQEALNRSGRWFDPRLVSVFLRISKNVDFWQTLAEPQLLDNIHTLIPAAHDKKLQESDFDTIAKCFGEIVDSKSVYTQNHSTRVARYAELMGTYLGMSKAELRWLHRAAMLHDLGKLGISNMILDKPDILDQHEIRIMSQHGLYDNPTLFPIRVLTTMIGHTNANYDTKLQENIIKIADVFDALTTDRPWRSAMPIEIALETIENEIGISITQQSFAALQAVIGPLEHFYERFGTAKDGFQQAIPVGYPTRKMVTGL